MATNDFVPFCSTNTGTNLLSQAAYLTDPQLPIGNQTGVSRSQLVNKALRQSTYISACLAQFLSNQTGDNVLDDATMSEVLATMLKKWPALPRAEITLNTQNGVGSTNTFVLRYSNVVVNTGGSIMSYTDDAALGGYITILTTGIYAINASIILGGTGGISQITRNSVGAAPLTFGLLGLSTTNDTVNSPTNVSTCRLLTAGDLIRVNTDGTTPGSQPYGGFSITQIGF